MLILKAIEKLNLYFTSLINISKLKLGLHYYVIYNVIILYMKFNIEKWLDSQ